MNFPRGEAQIVALCQKMVAGFTANATLYPAPPATPANLSSALSAYTGTRNAHVAAQAAAESALATKNDALEALVEAMKRDLRYAEMTVDGDDAKLSLLGWGGKAAATLTPPPGQCRVLETVEQGEGWVRLDWKEPADGGRPAAYRVQRRERPAGAWQDVATAVESEITLGDQPRGKEYEYRVIAVNKAGDGRESNTVMVVL